MASRLPLQYFYASTADARPYQLTLKDAEPTGDPASAWAMEFVVSATPGGVTKLSKTTTTGAVTFDNVNKRWNFVLSLNDHRVTLGAGVWYWTFNRTDPGSQLETAKGVLVISGASSTVDG